jgi:hypothetical protein
VSGRATPATVAAYFACLGLGFMLFEVALDRANATRIAPAIMVDECLARAPASCTATTSDGLPLNPGCDTDFTANGPSVVGEFKGSGTSSVWLFTVGKKWWIYDPSTAIKAFIAGGKDLAFFLRTLKP